MVKPRSVLPVDTSTRRRRSVTLGNGMGCWSGAICHRIARIGWVMFKVINTGVVTITGEGRGEEGIMDFSSVKLEREGSDISRA